MRYGIQKQNLKNGSGEFLFIFFTHLRDDLIMKTRSLMCCYVLTNVPECLEVSRFHCCLDLALVPPTTIRNPILHQSNIKMKYFTIVSLNGAYRRGGMSSS